MEQRLSLITLGVADLDRSRAFYADGLGWTPSTLGSGEVVFFQAAGVVFGLYGRAALAERAGARITKPAEEAFWGGYSGYFADPDGHLWEVAWNPGMEIDAAGHVSLPPDP